MPQDYYDSDSVGKRTGLPGAGVIGVMTGGQLHPPMVDSEKIWSRGENWYEGAKVTVRRLADMAGINGEDNVLDVGSGIGGPANLLASEYGCNVIGLNPSDVQRETASRRARELGLQDSVSHVPGIAQAIPFDEGVFSAVWSFNMFYHVGEKNDRAYEGKIKTMNEFYRVLREDGRLAFDDWMITEKAGRAERNELRYLWNSPEWMTDKDLMETLDSVGFKCTDWKDYSHVGRGVMKEYFGSVFERDFRRKIEVLDEKWGTQMADDVKSAIEYTIRMYAEDKMKYIQLIARK